MRDNGFRWWRAAAVSVALAVAAGPAVAHAGHPAPHNDDLDVQVSVGVDGVATAKIHAERYTPAGRPRGVQVMVPGSTYDHRYFDLGIGAVPSQARQAAEQGWLVIAVDRVGTGESSKPPAASVTTAVQVASLDSFVDRIDAMYRSLPIVLIGHSYGSVVAEGVAARSDKVDALVVTGFLYRRTAPSFEGFPELLPAATDPVLRKKKLPADYLTSEPGSRKFFHHVPNTSPAVLAADERSKSTTTAAEIPGFTEEFLGGAFAKAVRVPVFVVVGEHDHLYRGNDPAAFEPDQRTAFAAAPGVQVALVRDAGHDLALHRNASSTTSLINRWATRTITERVPS
ncbi:Lysophospholipase, alpha-beta hydrolase superfamily [Lentzea fradiae]|uniref:Lysophospholipase, alpha-beta hydrolase superfamily n=1 Tax=Lentzea fradiae TaxID=200378 RepID=A0A1G7KUW5_9PSEU|nr:alpha/beta fold hydrolase [Lentzea fradiae]SDF40995.1 Lysophospholipase, alpha-beta hydrolase superfamily [Lentzea fradiae]